ncbi:hypothetical protein RHSIM_Rhsim06G0002400 [Rhododendron simsii]|uniref:Uncharacterized protein n=1 Tax=Rhododendron simsii TaxID=118357 RepID=A0A834GV85_RHOSS|nr:hypothetical protein RHSIM_Rhsim06G0002400 [Rhododendron simsii]
MVTTVVDAATPVDWVKINVRETKGCFVVYAAVPGLLHEQVCAQSNPVGCGLLQVNQSSLTILGESQPSKGFDGQPHQREGLDGAIYTPFLDVNIRGGGRRWKSARGFRLNLRQFTVRRLQVRLFYLIRFFSRWKFRWDQQASHLLKKGTGNSCSNNCTKGTKRRTAAAMLESGRSSSYYDSSNSVYYSELAIRECLEFIKMSTTTSSSLSLSSDDQEAIDR